MAPTAGVVQLKPETLQAFAAYIREAEAAMELALRGEGAFLWSDADPERVRQLGQGKIVVQRWSGQEPVKVAMGLIHDWIGAVYIPETTAEATLAVVQNYDHHREIYAPEVIASALKKRDGDHFQVSLRLLKKKIITVVLETDHDVHYRCMGPGSWHCRSYSTRIAEVENAGSAKERALPPDTGYGFLWRLYSYWRFQDRNNGVYVECRAVSLTRDVPFGLGWVVEPIIQSLPKESLTHTLEATRQALRR